MGRTFLMLTGSAMLWLLAAAPATAGTPFKRQMTCPIGNERFTHTSTASYTIMGSRPDGKPYGSWEFPLQLPECPGNRLIMYKDFTPDELRRLSGLIARPEYRALRSEAQYYRLHWLMRELGSEPLDRLWALAQAAWQVPEGSSQRTRYLEEFAAGLAALQKVPTSMPEFAMHGRRINALRELGRFEESAALLSGTSLGPLREGGENGDEDAHDRKGLIAYYDMLQQLVARRDQSAEPLDFLPSDIAIPLCAERPAALTQWDRQFCEGNAEKVDRVRRNRS
jgi:hypothetical protein